MLLNIKIFFNLTLINIIDIISPLIVAILHIIIKKSRFTTFSNISVFR